MKYIIGWKDPDAIAMSDDRTFDDYFYKVPDEHYEIFRELGIGEYITVEVDTETRTARVVDKKG